jgi:hypothetical protein
MQLEDSMVEVQVDFGQGTLVEAEAEVLLISDKAPMVLRTVWLLQLVVAVVDITGVPQIMTAVVKEEMILDKLVLEADRLVVKELVLVVLK